MASKKSLGIRWPSGGLNQRAGYQHQAPFTTQDATNVRVDGTLEGRSRGGSRSGLSKSFYQEIGATGDPIRLLSEVTYIQKDGRDYWVDGFDQPSFNTTTWSTPTWGSYTAPNVIDSTSTALATTSNPEVGAVRAAISNFKHDGEYDVEMFLVPYQGEFGGHYSIFVRLDNTTPDVSTSGVEVRLTTTGSDGTYTGKFFDYDGGDPTVTAMTPGDIGTAKPGWFRVNVSGTTITAFWHGTSLGSITATTATASDKERVGFAMETLGATGENVIDAFRVQYTADDGREVPRRVLVASGGGELWRESVLGVLTEVGTGGTDPEVSSDHMVEAQEHLQKLYIADYSHNKAKGADGAVTGGTTFDSATYTDWTSDPDTTVDVDEDVVVIDGDGTYSLATVASGSLTLDVAATNATGLTFRVEKGPLVYDPSDDSISLWTATSGKGEVPTGCRHICLYRDRIILAGSRAQPHLWFMSRSGDPLDWDYSGDAEDLLRAVAGNNAPVAGRIGEPITCLAAWTDHFMLMGCHNSLWKMSGDPAYQGTLRPISDTIGVVSGKAWCKTPEGVFIFLSRDGLYALSPGGQGKPESMSRERLPRELRDVDPSITTATLIYDVERRGVYIFLTREDSGVAHHYFFDMEHRSFWRDKFGTVEHDPTQLHFYRSPDSTETCVLLGCRDGYLRRFRDVAEDDDGTRINSHVVIGPFRPGGSDWRDGLVKSIVGVLGEGSGDVTWSLLAADTFEDVHDQSAFATGTWTAGLNYREDPRARGPVVAVKLEEKDDNRAWVLEGFRMVIKPLGEHRKL